MCGPFISSRGGAGQQFEYEFTVLHYAVLKRDLPTMRVLLEGADCGRRRQALMEALRCCECAEGGGGEGFEAVDYPWHCCPPAVEWPLERVYSAGNVFRQGTATMGLTTAFHSTYRLRQMWR
jgi:hypothetical protein